MNELENAIGDVDSDDENNNKDGELEDEEFGKFI